MENTEDVCLSEDEEEITADTVLKTLQAAWQNERLAPEILPHCNDMVECMLGQIQHMEKNINKLPKTDLRACIHKMELSRIKFIICNYLKTRLHKIEKHCITIINDEKQRLESGTNYLTPAEYKYAHEYLLNMESHLKNAVLSKVPSNMQDFELNKMAVYPNLQSHVFLKANETVNGVVLEDLFGDQDEEIDLEEGSQHILRYKAVADLVKNGKVQLV
ncbi:DNA replication complex GINS protein SLD5 [Phthorimaea operculella]|nr:DNA replication complex GINS protein SLD5 [Phthorimaea operculella]